MVTVTFIKPSGEGQVIDALEGDNLMQVALNNGIDEILADCGGALSCATCHIHVSSEWFDRVGAPSATEEAMLEMAVEPDSYSRLSCQIALSAALDGLTVRLPPKQL